jgi:hypothetical protein
MKVYLLYANPYDEGDEIFGVFSTVRKAAVARKLFSSKSNNVLFICGMELDELEKHFERAKLPERLYLLHRMKFISGNGGRWSVSVCGLDAFISNNQKENYVVEWKSHTTAHIMAKSEEEAVEIAEKMIDEGRVLHYEN